MCKGALIAIFLSGFGLAACDNGASDDCACGERAGRSLEMKLSCNCGASRVVSSEGLDPCGTNEQMFRQRACDAGRLAVVKLSGCGKVAYMATAGINGGTTATFDQASGKLLGTAEFTDIGVGTCRAPHYRFGDVLRPTSDNDGGNCSAVQFCLVCGDKTKLAHGSDHNLPYPLPACPP